MSALAQFSNTKGNVYCHEFREQMHRSSNEFYALKRALATRRNTAADRSASVICKALFAAHEFSQTSASATSLQMMEPIIEGCFYEAERLLCSGELSPSSRDQIQQAFRQHDDLFRLKRVFERELRLFETWDALSLRLAVKNLVFGGPSRYGFAGGIIRNLRYLPFNLKHELRMQISFVRHLVRDMKEVSTNSSLQKVQNETAACFHFVELPYPVRLHEYRKMACEFDKFSFLPNVVECDAWMLARCRLTLQAIAIQAYEAITGTTPESVREVEVSIGPYSGEPFQYERLGRGFRLSSVGPGVLMTPSLSRMKEVHFYPYSKHLVLTVIPGAKDNVDGRPLGFVATTDTAIRWQMENEAQTMAECDDDDDLEDLPPSA